MESDPLKGTVRCLEKSCLQIFSIFYRVLRSLEVLRAQSRFLFLVPLGRPNSLNDLGVEMVRDLSGKEMIQY